MKKIVSVFQRNYDGDRLVRNEVVPGAEWALAGEGVATRKLDGTCCMLRAGILYKRYEVKPGGTAPANFAPANEVDEATGKQQGWIPVGAGAEDKWHREALGRLSLPADGTYELVGPKVQGNPEQLICHVLIRHGDEVLLDAPRDFDGLKTYLATHNIEGIVFHHADGRMAKVKGKDFGLRRIGP